MKERGELFHDPDAPEGPPPGEDDLGDDFWANAVLEAPRTRSVHLRIDGEVWDHFREETGGRGHLTRMQAVLRAYVRARRAGRAP